MCFCLSGIAGHPASERHNIILLAVHPHCKVSSINWQEDIPPKAKPHPMPDLAVTLGRLRLPNPILVASGTFGYAREMAGSVDLSRLGGVIPKTVTRQPRVGNPPPRTVETPSGMLNAIGLDND